MSNTIASVEQLLVYPVKSMAGIAVSGLRVGRRGPAGDRRWMLVDPHGRFVTGRQLPALVRCAAQYRADGITLQMDGDRLEVATPVHDAPPVSVVIWRDRCPAADAGDEAAEWLSERFGRPLRLVWQGDQQRRPLTASHAHAPDDEVSFADGYPLLLIGTASLDALNSRLSLPVTMRHFRPNIVVRTRQAFIEDDWTYVRIGEVTFVVASTCARCIFTTVDPDTGERREDGEPLRTLRGFRRDDDSGKILFGVNLIPLAEGDIPGDALVQTVAPASLPGNSGA